MDKLFERATRRQLRFQYRGSLSVEDLWELSMESLDYIYSALKKTQSSREESLIKRKTAEDEDNDLRVAVVEYIFGVFKAEKEEREQALVRRQKREKILEALQRKDDEEILGKSKEELLQHLEQLDSMPAGVPVSSPA